MKCFEELLLKGLHPRLHGLSRLLLECGAEGAVAMESAFERELLGGDNAAFGSCLPVQADEMVYTKTVDISVECEPLLGKMLAQISPVCTDDIGKLGQSKIILQVKLIILAVLFQEYVHLGGGFL